VSTILAVSAHPDDETLFSGGTLAMYARQNHDVYILETTRGEGGEVGDPPLAERKNLGEVREKEARAAAGALGVKDIFFLPFVDPHMEIGGTPLAIDASLEAFAGAVGEYIRKIKPDLVLTHGSNGEYGHPQHIYTHRAVCKALADREENIALMTWQAWYEPSVYARVLNRDDPADMIFDITEWREAKVNAAMCHKTQHAMFLRNSGLPSVADMVWNMESFRIVKGPVPEVLAIPC
jgi:N-acetylglucosamine malate deacetylase 2